MSISFLILSILALTWLIIIISMGANKWKITGSGLFLTACLLGLTTSMNQNQTLFHLAIVCAWASLAFYLGGITQA